MFEVNVSPDMGMYHLLRSQGYDPAYALAEFIDNAIHAHQASKSKSVLEINLKFYLADYKDHYFRNSIIISDDGPGITKTALATAMKPARPSKTKGLSEFGIGMKAAAVWFTDLWELDTTPHSTKDHFHLKFDLNALISNAVDKVEVTEKKDGRAPGTTISLRTIRRVINHEKYKEICTTLRELYQKFTEGVSPQLKLIAHLNDTPTDLKFTLPPRAILEAPVHKKIGDMQYTIGKSKVWQVAIDAVFNGHKVEGTICLLETGSYTGNPGLVLFRHQRVITGTTANPYIPSKLVGTANKYGRQRVYGELHMDDMPVTYTKDKFEIDEANFVDKLLEDEKLVDLIRQAEAYRASDKTQVKHVDSEKDIQGKGKDKKPKEKAAGKPTSGAKTEGGKKPAEKPLKQPPEPAFVVLLRKLQASTSSLGLKSIIQETIYLYQWRRDISAGLCMRIVVELGVLNKLERDYPLEYTRMSDDGIKKILGKINAAPDAFFDRKRDAKIIKCVQNMATGVQADIIMLNNISHGSYQPIRKEIDTLVLNLEPILDWAYS